MTRMSPNHASLYLQFFDSNARPVTYFGCPVSPLKVWFSRNSDSVIAIVLIFMNGNYLIVIVIYDLV